MKLCGLIAAAGASLAMSAGVSLADITYTAQARSIRVRIDGSALPQHQASFAAGDFGPFDASADVGDFSVECHAIANQHSRLLPDQITATGDVYAKDGIQFYGGWAESLFDVTFDLAQPVAYRLAGDWAGSSGWPLGELRVKLTGPAGVVYESYYRWTIDESEVFDTIGILPAGSYRLYIRAQGELRGLSPGGSAVFGNYDVTMATSECLADINGDGLVDFSDYLEFLNLFDAGDPRVDFNMDGIVDFADYLEFLNLFDAGC